MPGIESLRFRTSGGPGPARWSGAIRCPGAGIYSCPPGASQALAAGFRPALLLLLVACAGLLVAGDSGAGRVVARPAAALDFRLAGHAGGAIRAVSVHQGEVWIGQGIGVSRVDLADGESAAIVEHVPLSLGSDVYSLARHDRYLYAGARDGLWILDVGPPAVRVAAHFVTPGTIRALTYYTPLGPGPGWLFMSDDLAGVVLAVVEGATVRATSVVLSDGGARSAVAVADDLAMIPGDDLYIVELAEPEMPVEVGRLVTRGQVRGVTAGPPGSRLVYVSDSAEGLLAVDFTDPRQPVVRGFLGGVPSGELLRLGSVLYIIDRGVNLVTVDSADPSRLSYVGVYGGLTGAVAIGLAGDMFLAAAGNQLMVASFSPANPLYQPHVLARLHSAWPVRQHLLLPDHVYLARGEEGLMAVRVIPPERPEVALEYAPPWGAFGLAARNHRLYVSTIRGFEVWDVTDPASPVPITNQPFAQWSATAWIAVTDQRLVATTRERLHIASLAAGQLPSEVAELVYARLPAWPADAVPQGLALFGDTVIYVPAGDAGIAVLTVDDQDPASIRPELRAFVTTPVGVQARTALVAGSLLALGTQDGVVLYDLGDPLRPQPIAHHRAGYGVLSLAMAEGRLFVAADVNGLLVLDLAEPRLPSVAGWLRPDYPISGVVAESDRLYVAGAGLSIVDVLSAVDRTPPATPQPLPTWPSAVPTATPRPTEWRTSTPTMVATNTATPSAPATFTASPEPWAVRLYLPWCTR